MEFSQEWRSLWPISSAHTLPLLLQSRSLGPLVFNPISKTLTLLLSSPSSLSPSVLPPPPSLSLSRFLQTSTSHDSPVLPSTASAIANSFDDYTSNDAILHNRLEPLICPGNRVIVFFPSGKNLDRVGFLVLSLRDTNLVVDSNFSSSLEFKNQFVRLCACPVEEYVMDGYSVVGFLMACTLYAVHWFAVKLGGHGSDFGTPVLKFLGTKLFKSCAVAYACWNPHLSGECLVLLESGELFLFDMSSSRVSAKFRGKRISVPWKEMSEWKASEWFSCVFSWHPRILIVANSMAVYIVDLRYDKCQLSCLVTIGSLNAEEVAGEDRFVALSKAGRNDNFLYSVATEHWLLLLDVRKPLMPVLRWAHNLQKPRYMTALPLSYLRSNPGDEEYAGVSDMGFAIMLGSFWNNDFSIFCYGRPPSATIPTISTEISKLSDVIYAWELPSLLSVRGRDCPCGSCLVMEDSAKEDLPEWIECQRERELVLGFFILDKKLSSFVQKPGEHGGFTLIRLMSSGKLESQQYRASWKVSTATTTHGETEKYLNDSLLSSMADYTYKLTKKFSYFKFENLYGYLNDNLAQILFPKFRRAPKIAGEQKHHDDRFFNFISEKLKSFGCNPPISDLSRSDIFRDVIMPTSLFEIACRVLWIKLPMDVLEMAFSTYTEVHGTRTDKKKAKLEFPIIPDQDHAPFFFLKCPSLRSNERSSKVQLSDDFVGPLLPLPVALVVYEISKHGYSLVEKTDEASPEKAFFLQCKTIASLAKEVGVSCFSSDEDKRCPGSLVDDNEETLVGSLNTSILFLYKASACPDEPAGVHTVEKPNGLSPEAERFNLVVAKLPEHERTDEEINMDVVNLLDDLCPVELKFNSPGCAPEELREYELLKTDFSKWRDSFIPYRNLCARLKPQQQDVKPCWDTCISLPTLQKPEADYATHLISSHICAPLYAYLPFRSKNIPLPLALGFRLWDVLTRLWSIGPVGVMCECDDIFCQTGGPNQDDLFCPTDSCSYIGHQQHGQMGSGTCVNGC
ncbi:hypothetical protein Cgig2_009953 [Carnegiea gigantea]|uniref:TAF1C beta-propeller domain-containing protein n=1 Tax=Carnegiea gigantea TaxID=171969 RepID=A0A9Q1JP10_9CARY|nr:hypothetical protein Cgig2_009953 [Carnegiea gigantea]